MDSYCTAMIRIRDVVEVVVDRPRGFIVGRDRT